MLKTPIIPLLLSISLLAGLAQTAAQQAAHPVSIALPAAYDVVSIRIDKTARNSWGIDVNGDTFHAGNVLLRELLAGAYGIQPELISGIPDSIDSARFDIDAKIVDPDPEALKKLTTEQRGAMMRPVLAERFAIKAHIETKILPTFDLVVARGGPKLTASPASDTRRNSSTSIHSTALIASDLTMTKLAGTLTGIVRRKVVDKTGLSGKYDLTLRWSPDDIPTQSESSSGNPTDVPPVIFTAIQDQLGLKLQPSKGPVDTLVIDHAEMPTEN